MPIAKHKSKPRKARPRAEFRGETARASAAKSRAKNAKPTREEALPGGGKPKSFRGTLERMPGNLGWVIVRVPFSVEKTWGSRGMFRVKGEINGFPFRKALFPTKRGQHFLLVNNAMQKGAGVQPGMPADFRIEPDGEKHVVPVPRALKRFLAQDAMLRRWFEKLNTSTRNWIGSLVAQPKSAASRQRRAEQMAECLLAAMDAEHELPPALKLAFHANPQAYEGWQMMTPNQRRGNLLAIHYYRSPDARERRLEKVLEAAAAVAERKRAGMRPTA